MGAIQSSIIFLLLLFLSLLGLVSCDDSSLQDKCSPLVTQLTSCLDYSTAKSDTPTTQCCSSVSDIRGQQPVCLCYIIQQTNSGGSAVKSLGLQINRLINLPQACKLANASTSDCPKLLNLSPSSPDYAIFTNTTKATSSSTRPAVANTKSEGIMHQIHIGGTFTIAVISVVLSIFFVGA